MRYQERLCLPNMDDLRNWIIDQAHGSRYLIYLGITMMYQNLTETFLWDILERDIEKFVAKCPNCKQVKVEHQKSGGLLQEMQVPPWKREDINMDFVVVLPLK